MSTIKDRELLIRAILATQKTSTGAAQSCNSRYLTQEGWQEGKPQSFESGSFQGRAGTIRRSNKGRTYRAPNGSRRYIIDYNTEVIAYVP